ncbi:MAG: N-acetylmuramoyl-L-alanine amidase [Pseudomonadota bacterium]
MKMGPFPPVVLTAFLLLTFSLTPVFADMPTNPSPGRAVFVDPGHGGEDSGSEGPGGTLEKEVTLRIARLVSDRLNGKYRLNSSRTDDYHIDIFDRAGLANDSKADLFISIHVGGSFRHSANGFCLYYYEPSLNPNDSNRLSAENSAALFSDREQWRAIQLKHFSASRQLARYIRNRLGQFSDQPTFVTGANALVLAGADMPAILIEIGCLATPSEEKKLSDMGYLARIADAINIGITDYLGDNSGISSMDLHQ